MKVHPIIVTAVVSAMMALQAWTLCCVIDLKVSLAETNARFAAHLAAVGQTPKQKEP